MNTVLPKPSEAQQLCRLRSLRVQRAQARCRQLQAELATAARAVRECQRKIESSTHQIDALSQAVVNALAPRLPRWGGVAAAQRDRLVDRLEREEDALITDQRSLEQARERLAQANAERAQALAREDAVHDLAQRARRAQAHGLERCVERELEDQAALASALRQPGPTL